MVISFQWPHHAAISIVVGLGEDERHAYRRLDILMDGLLTRARPFLYRLRDIGPRTNPAIVSSSTTSKPMYLQNPLIFARLFPETLCSVDRTSHAILSTRYCCCCVLSIVQFLDFFYLSSYAARSLFCPPKYKNTASARCV